MLNIFATYADSLAGANQLSLLLASGVAVAISVYNKVLWSEIMRNIVHTCGATQASILGVATIAYLPFAFFCWLSPILTLIVAWCGWGIKKED